MDRYYDTLRKLKVANFADIFQIVTMFIKTTFKDPKKVKRIRYYVLKCNLYMHFLKQQKLLISGETKLMSVELMDCIIWCMYFLE